MAWWRSVVRACSARRRQSRRGIWLSRFCRVFTPDGYAQAAHMLATEDITADLARLPAGLPIQFIVGEADHAACRQPGNHSRMPNCVDTCHPQCWLRALPGGPKQFNRLRADFVAAHAAA